MTKQNIVRIAGAALGLLVGILILTIGFFKTLLLAVLAALGWYLGGSRQLPQRINRALGRIFPKGDK